MSSKVVFFFVQESKQWKGKLRPVAKLDPNDVGRCGVF